MKRPSGILDIEMQLQKFQHPQLRGWLNDEHERQIQIQLGQVAKAAFSGASQQYLAGKLMSDTNKLGVGKSILKR